MSRTLNTFPLKGKTPYKSLPSFYIPLIAKLFAESPSVRIKVHLLDLPARLAS